VGYDSTEKITNGQEYVSEAIDDIEQSVELFKSNKKREARGKLSAGQKRLDELVVFLNVRIGELLMPLSESYEALIQKEEH